MALAKTTSGNQRELSTVCTPHSARLARGGSATAAPPGPGARAAPSGPSYGPRCRAHVHRHRGRCHNIGCAYHPPRAAVLSCDCRQLERHQRPSNLSSIPDLLGGSVSYVQRIRMTGSHPPDLCKFPGATVLRQSPKTIHSPEYIHGINCSLRRPSSHGSPSPLEKFDSSLGFLYEFSMSFNILLQFSLLMLSNINPWRIVLAFCPSRFPLPATLRNISRFQTVRISTPRHLIITFRAYNWRFFISVPCQ